jgi:hypothetical protein
VSRPITILSGSKSSELPNEASEIDAQYKPGPVVVTGSDIPEEIEGIPTISETSFTVEMAMEPWTIDFANIQSVNCTQIERLHIVIVTFTGNRYDVGFDEADVAEGNKLKQKIQRAIDDRT